MKAQLGLGGYFVKPVADPITIIQSAYDLGINVFDTSPAYGDSEEWFGKALDGVDRDSYCINTKTKSLTVDHMLIDFHRSIKKLKSNYIDTYFGHSFIDDLDTYNKSIPVLESMNRLKGNLITKVGVSGHSVEAARRAILSGLVDAIMVPHSIVYNKFSAIIKDAKQYNVEVYTMKNFASGILTGGTFALSEEVTPKHIMDYSAFVGDFIIPACRSVFQLIENNYLYQNAKEMNLHEIDVIKEKIYGILGKDFCRFCNECRPCHKFGWSMSQPTILKTALYYEKLGRKEMVDEYKNIKLNVKDCGDCEECSNKCPYMPDIKEAMIHAHTILGGE